MLAVWPRDISVLAIILMLCMLQVQADTTLVLNSPAGNPITNPQQTGFIDQLVGEALSRLGFQLDVEHLPAERAILLADSGFADGELIRIGGLQKLYPNLIQVPEKIFDMEFIAFGKNPELRIENWQDLKQYSVGIITGWKILENKMPDEVDLTKVKNPQQLFELLNKDRANVVLFSRWQGMAFIQANGYQEILPVGSPLVTTEMFVYLNQKHADQVAALAEILRSMKQDGSYRQLREQALGGLIR